MKKARLGPAVLFVSVLVVVLTSFVFSTKTLAVTEEARTLQLIAPYRMWGKANAQPIVLSIDKVAPFG
jgi:hypothetical protein